MIDLGTVRPGSTVRIPFSSFDKDDGSSITMTNYAAADILIYKDGGTTERASTSGFTATTDFDSKTGKHLAIIDLADNTTAGFFNAGSEYLVAIDAVTVDGVTTGGWIGRFRIGYPNAVLNTTIATLSTQTSMTLTVGPAEDNALVGYWAIIHDIASAVQQAKVLITAYTGSTKTITLAAGATFTAAAGDNISIMDIAPLQPATLGRTVVVDSAGLVDANAVKLGPSGSGTAQTARDIGASVLLSAGSGTGQLDFTSGVVKANVTQFGGSNGTFSSGRPEVNTTHAAGTAWNSGGITSLTFATDSITSTVIKSNAIDKIAAGVWQDITAGDFTVANSIGKSVMNGVALGTGLTINAYTGNTPQTGDSYARIGANGVGLSNITLPSGGLANVTTWTVDITGNITGNLSGSVGSVTGAVGSVAGAVGSVTGNVGGNVTGSVGSLGATAKSDVNAEVVDALATDTYAEPAQGAPAATTTLAAKLNYLYKAWRNKKLQTASQYSLLNDDAATVDHKAAVSDDGTTTTIGEVASGP